MRSLLNCHPAGLPGGGWENVLVTMSAQTGHFRRVWFLGAGLLALAVPVYPAGFESLLRSSPFGQPATGSAGGPTAQPLEFRGVMLEGGKEYFSIHETKTRNSMWLGFNEPGQPFLVREYDSARGIITVEYQGSVIALPLKNAVILVSSPGIARPAPTETKATAPTNSGGDRMRQLIEDARRRTAAKLVQK